MQSPLTDSANTMAENIHTRTEILMLKTPSNDGFQGICVFELLQVVYMLSCTWFCGSGANSRGKRLLSTDLQEENTKGVGVYSHCGSRHLNSPRCLRMQMYTRTGYLSGTF